MDGTQRAGTPQLELRLLGPLEGSKGGDVLVLGGQKPRALLAVLALEPGRVVSVDRLVEALWPGDPPETAAHAIQVYVSQLRKALGAKTLVTRPPGYALEVEPEHVDVHRFARLLAEGRAALEPRTQPRPKERCAKRSHSGAARLSPTSSTSRSRRPRSRASRSSARLRSRSASRRISHSVVMSSSSPSSKRSSPRSRCASGHARS